MFMIITPNHQIIRKSNIHSVWIEDLHSGEHHVFLKDTDEIDWRIGEFKTWEEASTYVRVLYKDLTNDA